MKRTAFLILLLMFTLAFNINTTVNAAQTRQVESQGHSGGDLNWNRTYDGPIHGHGDSLVEVSTGGYAIVGRYHNYTPTDYTPIVTIEDTILIRTDEDGNQLWNKTYDNTLFIASIIEVSSGGFLLAGQTGEVIRTDFDGNVVWNVTYNIGCKSLIEVSTGGFALAGTDDNEGNRESDVRLIHINTDGTILWTNTLRNPGWDDGSAVIEVSTGGFAIAGGLSVSSNLHKALIRYDSNGNIQWNETYLRGGASDVVEVSSGGFAMVASEGSVSYLIRISETGDQLWRTDYDVYDLHHILEMSTGGYAIFGEDGGLWLGRTFTNGTLFWHKEYTWDIDPWGGDIVEASSGNIVITGTLEIFDYESLRYFEDIYLASIDSGPDISVLEGEDWFPLIIIMSFFSSIVVVWAFIRSRRIIVVD
ncbi:MAG: hypothetical protein ACXAEB_11340 [Candidatus Thorarchaeota archaeon]